MAEQPRHAARYSAGAFDSEPDGRIHAPAAARNAEAIREVLASLIGDGGTILEIGSGTGQHAAHFAAAFPRHRWVPSDPDPGHRASIVAWGRHARVTNLADPLALDAAGDWAADPAVAALSPVAVFSANVIHIAPWAVAEGIVTGAARILRPGGRLIFYGPFRENGEHTGEGNRTFDARLRGENPAWGLRDTADVARLADAAGFAIPPALFEMPANNRVLAFTRT